MYYKTKTLYFQNEYYDIEMFWRITRMIKVTANVLRQQITNRECNTILIYVIYKLKLYILI